MSVVLLSARPRSRPAETSRASALAKFKTLSATEEAAEAEKFLKKVSDRSNESYLKEIEALPAVKGFDTAAASLVAGGC